MFLLQMLASLILGCGQTWCNAATAVHWHVWTSMGAKIFPGNQIGITEATCGNPVTQTDLCPTNDVWICPGFPLCQLILDHIDYLDHYLQLQGSLHNQLHSYDMVELQANQGYFSWNQVLVICYDLLPFISASLILGRGESDVICVELMQAGRCIFLPIKFQISKNFQGFLHFSIAPLWA